MKLARTLLTCDNHTMKEFLNKNIELPANIRSVLTIILALAAHAVSLYGIFSVFRAPEDNDPSVGFNFILVAFLIVTFSPLIFAGPYFIYQSEKQKALRVSRGQILIVRTINWVYLALILPVIYFAANGS